MEGVLALESAGSGYRKNPFGETLSLLGLVPEAELSPLDGKPQCLLGRVVGGLHSLVGEEGEKMRPVLEHAPGTSAHLQELLPADEPFPESMPAGEDMPDLLQHVFGEDVSVTGGVKMYRKWRFKNV